MRLPFVLFALAPIALFGCATSGVDDIDSGTGVDAGKVDASKDGAKDTGKDTSGPVCVPSCSQDTECQNSCAAPQSGIWCCDMATSLCYNSSDQSCPAPQDGGGVDP